MTQITEQMHCCEIGSKSSYHGDPDDHATWLRLLNDSKFVQDATWLLIAVVENLTEDQELTEMLVNHWDEIERPAEVYAFVRVVQQAQAHFDAWCQMRDEASGRAGKLK